jgi:hypothetical protein
MLGNLQGYLLQDVQGFLRIYVRLNLLKNLQRNVRPNLRLHMFL